MNTINNKQNPKEFMTTKLTLQKILQGLLHTEEEVRASQKNARKNIPFGPSRLVNKEWGKSKYQRNKNT
jgi:hypothetical protein